MCSYVLSILIMMTAIVILGEMWKYNNKANLRDLIAATGLENYRATLLHYTKLCASSWWRHQMEKFSALLAFCAGNSPIPGEFPAQRPVTRNFDVFFDLRLNKRLSKLSWSWWSETPSSSLWPHRNDLTPLGEFKQDLLSGNAQFGSKSAFFVPCDLEIWWMTLKTIGHLFYTTLSFVHHLKAICDFKRALQFGNA